MDKSPSVLVHEPFYSDLYGDAKEAVFIKGYGLRVSVLLQDLRAVSTSLRLSCREKESLVPITFPSYFIFV